SFDRLWKAHLLDRFTLPDIASLPEVAWFGFISLSITVIAIPTTEIVRRRVNTGDPAAVVRAMRIITIFIFTGVLTFALAQRLSLALVMLVIAHLMRRLIGPLQHVWLNQGLDSRVRATIFSAVGQMDAFGQIALGPVLGLIALETSMPTVLVISALMLLPVLRIYGLTLSMGEKAAASQAAAS
ncbi:MAG TPA: hypothetical protein VJZ27_04370, partial [Aggregatilineales bacterium]|nr:hypothetical protein [Aggregatilineales bacterium]